MIDIVLDTNTLPPPIRERFCTPKVSVKEYSDCVMIKPLEISRFRGIAKGSKFTTEKLFEYRNEEKVFEDRCFEE